MDQAKSPDTADFENFVNRVEPGLRRALFAVLGAERGREATAEALAWAWEHWSRVVDVENPVGYLFRVGQSRSRTKRFRAVHEPTAWSEPVIEPQLTKALADLSESQRVAVILVHGFGWTMREVGELTGIKVTTVQTHLDRGLSKLRTILEVDENA